MKAKLMAVLACLALWHAASAQEVAREVPADVTLDVDPAGQVVHVQLPAQFPGMLATAASQVMTHWRFKPVQREGRPVAARTYARVKVQLIKLGNDRFGIQVAYLSNGPRLQPIVAPYYPLRETQHAEAALLLEAVVAPEGTLADVRVVEAHFSGGSRTHLFEQSAVQAVQHWHADPETVDGQPVATRIQIPMTFCLGADGACANSLPPLEHWHPAHAGESVSPPVLGEVVAVDSPLQPAAASPGG